MISFKVGLMTMFIPYQLFASDLSAAYRLRENAHLLRGAAIGVVSSHGEQVSRYGDGQVPSAQFEIGSVSKAFTGIMAAQLEIEKKISLDLPISHYIPEFRDTFIGTVTIGELATHRARLINSYLDANGNRSEKESPEELISFLKNYRPDPALFPAGHRSYSNLGFATLGLVIRRVEKTDSFTKIIRRRIFSPLGMNHTGFIINEAKPKKLVKGFDALLQPSAYYSMSDLDCASGGIVSDLPDMMNFLRANVFPEKSPLAEAIQLSHKLGLGWDSEPGVLPISKNGAMPAGFASFLILDPTPGKETGSIVLTNVLNTSVAKGLGTIAVGGNDTALPQQALNAVAASAVANFKGTYKTEDSRSAIRIFEVGSGFIGAEESSGGKSRKVRLYPFNASLLLVDTGLQIADAIQFMQSGDSVNGVVYLEYKGNDSDGKPVYDKTYFKKY
jgi:CubicO group peptidase (beta-lactamase class C family)